MLSGKHPLNHPEDEGHPENSPELVLPSQFAGSIFGLEPDTTYQIELHAVYSDDGGVHANDDAINLQGQGHVVCHNDIIGFADECPAVHGGPVYALRNVIVNVVDEQLKFHALGTNPPQEPNAVLVYHNTFVSPRIRSAGRRLGAERPRSHWLDLRVRARPRGELHRRSNPR